MLKKVIAVSVAAAIAAAGVVGAQSMRTPDLFEVSSAKSGAVLPAAANNMLRGKSAQWAARVSVKREMLTGAQREMMLDMPEGPRLRMRLAKFRRAGNGDIVWSGADRLTLDGRMDLSGKAPATALFVVRGKRIVGQISTANGEVYELLTSEDGAQQIMVKRDPASLEGADDTPAHVGIPQQPENSRRVSARAEAVNRAGETVIRVLQVYTPEAVTELGGQNGANDRAAFFIAQSNTTFANNGLAVLFESAGVQFTAQAQSTNDSSTLVSRIQGTTDGWFDAYSTTERNSTGADLVALVVRDGLASGSSLLCGQATSIGAVASGGFFVQNHVCTSFTFVHEAAHLFGARHDNDRTTTPFRYGHGYVNAGANFRTIMAVNSNPQPRIGYFSTIDQTFTGGTLGTSRTNDNERVMRERAAAMAAFR
jgi:peptidyl-Asp metalloendopeptidase